MLDITETLAAARFALENGRRADFARLRDLLVHDAVRADQPQADEAVALAALLTLAERGCG